MNSYNTYITNTKTNITYNTRYNTCTSYNTYIAIQLEKTVLTALCDCDWHYFLQWS